MLESLPPSVLALLLLACVGVLSEIGRRWISSVSAKADIGVIQADRVNALHDRLARVESSLGKCQNESTSTTDELKTQIHDLDKAVGLLASSDAVSGLRADMAELRANMHALVTQMGDLKASLAAMAESRRAPSKGR